METVTAQDMEDARLLGERSGLNMSDDWDQFIHDVAQTIADGRRAVAAPAMSEPTEQQVEAALRVWYPVANDATIVLLMKNGTGDLMRNVLSTASRAT